MSKVISEIGVNWNGSMSTAKYMITKSKLAGADYVKFQLFNQSIIENTECEHKLSQMILGVDELAELKAQSDIDNIGFIVSCMYPESFEIAESVKPDYIKIRHFDRNNDELAKLAIDYCIKTNTKVIISSDTYSDMSNIYRMRPLICYYMYCIPRYPPDFKDEISIINKRPFERSIWSGFSSHFKNILIPSLAVLDDVKFVEVHVGTFDTDIDDNVSISFERLKQLCDISKGVYL